MEEPPAGLRVSRRALMAPVPVIAILRLFLPVKMLILFTAFGSSKFTADERRIHPCQSLTLS